MPRANKNTNQAQNKDTAFDGSALITATYGRHHTIECTDGTLLRCHTRGKAQRTGRKHSRLHHAVVGDTVQYSLAGDEAVIESIEPRRNVLYRQDHMRNKVFVANIDLVLIWTATEPVPHPLQLAKTLIACEDAGIPVQIVLNKSDLPCPQSTEAELAELERVGYRCHRISSTQPQDFATKWEALLAELAERRTFIMGASGTGKSTFINQLVPAAQAATQSISTALQAGKHTTTHTRLYWLNQPHSALIDSPGFQDFGIQHLEATKLDQLMPDVRAAAQNGCKFHNCTHLHEPQCSVIAAAHDPNNHTLSEVRWRMYQQLWQEISTK